MKRPREHVLEEESRRALRALLPSNWIKRKFEPDYGIDEEVTIVEDEEVTNKVPWLQLKATESLKDGSKETSLQMKTKHLKHYEHSRFPVLIFYWVKSEDTFYYLFAQKYIKETLSEQNPNWRKQRSVTVKFPVDTKLKDVKHLETIATDGYFYVILQQLALQTGSGTAHYWLDGIPQSDNSELKERTLKAVLYYRGEKHHDAINEFEDILKKCTTSPSERMSILLNLGNSYLSLSKNDEALKNYQAVLNLAEKTYDMSASEGKLVALGNIGLIYSAKGDLDTALKHHQDALEIDREIGYRQGEANQLGNIGLIYSNKGKPDDALKHHQDALKIHKEIGYRRGEASGLGNIGLFYLKKGDLDTAQKYLKDALKICKEIGYRRGEAIQRGNIGLICLDKGDLDAALKHHQYALKIDREIGHRHGEAIQLGNIGLIYKAKGKLDDALKHHQDALNIDREIGYRQGEASNLGNIGILYKAKGDPDVALKYLKDALAVLDKFNLVYGRDVFQRAIDLIRKEKAKND